MIRDIPNRNSPPPIKGAGRMRAASSTRKYLELTARWVVVSPEYLYRSRCCLCPLAGPRPVFVRIAPVCHIRGQARTYSADGRRTWSAPMAQIGSVILWQVFGVLREVGGAPSA